MAMRQQQADEATDIAVAPANADRVADWLDELDAVLANAAGLTPAVRAALVAAINAFEAEDGGLPPTAQRARALLLGAPESDHCRRASAAVPVTHPPRRQLTGRRAAVPA